MNERTRWLLIFQDYWVKHLLNLVKYANKLKYLPPLLRYRYTIWASNWKKKECCFYKSVELNGHDFGDIHLGCRCNMFGINPSTCTDQDGGRQAPWQVCATANTWCGFSKHMTSMITSMGALNRFKFCTGVARQQHNRSLSPSPPTHVADYWDCCGSITENG